LLNQHGFSRQRLDSPEGPIDFGSIPPLLRLLLVTDGTVTKSIEALFNIPIKVLVARQEPVDKTEWISNYPFRLISSKMLARDVTLVRADSLQVMARAHSTIALDLLPRDLAAGLLEGKLGIGELIRSQGIDTYRSLTDVGISKRGDNLGLWRRYAICQRQLVLMQVEEWFPWTVYAWAN